MGIETIGFDLYGDDPSEDGDDTGLNPELLHFLLEQDQDKNSRRESASLRSSRHSLSRLPESGATSTLPQLPYYGEYLPSADRGIPYSSPLEY